MTARPVALVLSLALGAAGLGALAAAPSATAAGCGTVLSATRNGADARSQVTTTCPAPRSPGSPTPGART